MAQYLKKSILAISVAALSYLTLLSGFYFSGDKFHGSPPRRFSSPRNNIEHPYFLSPKKILNKISRVTRYENSSKTESLFPFFQKNGWLVMKDSVEVSGTIVEIHNSGYYNYLFNKPPGNGDGDLHIILKADQGYEEYASPIEYLSNKKVIHLEIDWNLRKNFPIFPDLAVGDHIMARGRYVIDEAHSWKEIHPPYWIDFVDIPDTTKERKKSLESKVTED